MRGCKENYFCDPAVEKMKISMELPVMVTVDNMGAIFMVSNITTTLHAKILTSGISM